MQEMTMVERVARAIYEGRNGRGCAPWSRQSNSHKSPYLGDARASIEALREPTEKMLGAFDRMTDDSGSVLVKTGYRAMIDAALSE